jgi:hypothetical protein
MPEEEILPGEPPDTDEEGNSISVNDHEKIILSRNVLTIRIEIQDSGPGSTLLYLQANNNIALITF